MPWNRLADELRTDDSLSGMNSSQLDAVVEVLALTIYADGNAGYLEQLELERLLQKLPWFEDKSTGMKQTIAASLALVKDVQAEEEFRAIASSAANKLPEARHRKKVLEMAATLACADHHLHRKEKRALSWLATTFEISDDDASAIIDRVAEKHL